MTMIQRKSWRRKKEGEGQRKKKETRGKKGRKWRGDKQEKLWKTPEDNKKKKQKIYKNGARTDVPKPS